MPIQSEQLEQLNSITQFVVPYIIVGPDPSAPSLAAYSIACKNRDHIRNTYNTFLSWSPKSALSQITGYWVSYVMPGGAWDYKVQPGYSPWYKQWYARSRYKTSLETSEWFGNYNFGMTGRVIYPLSVLQTGADVVGGAGPKSPDDVASVSQGYNEY